MWIQTHLLLNLYGVTESANIKLLCGTNISSSGDFISQRSLTLMELFFWRAAVRELVRPYNESAIGLKTEKWHHRSTWKYKLTYNQAESFMEFTSWNYPLLSLFKNRVKGLPLTFSSKIRIKLVWKTDIVAWGPLVFSAQIPSCSARFYLRCSRKILFF